MRNVEILLSGESRNTTPLHPKIITDLKFSAKMGISSRLEAVAESLL